jgi:hypothetical protein
MRCAIRLSAHTGQVVFVVTSVAGTDETILCGKCYLELVPPMAQIELVRCGRTVDLDLS